MLALLPLRLFCIHVSCFSLQLLLDEVLLILALFVARASPSFGHDFSITHNAQAACPLICCLIFSAVIITPITIQLATTLPSFQTYLARDCFHISFALNITRNTSYSILRYQPLTVRHSRSTVWCFWFSALKLVGWL